MFTFALLILVSLQQVPKAPEVIETPRVDDVQPVQAQKAQQQKPSIVEHLEVQKATPVQSATQKAPTAVVVPTQKAVQVPAQKSYSVSYGDHEDGNRRQRRRDRRGDRRSYAGLGVGIGFGLCGRFGCN